jgi:uncharacterized protein YqhQ
MSQAETRPYIGGQAVIEGVMMRSPRSFAVVVRRRSGALVVRESPAPSLAKGGPRTWPFVRGAFVLGEAMKLGARALRFSGEIYEEDADEAEREEKRAAAAAKRPGVLSALALAVVSVANEDGTSEPAAADAPAPAAGGSAGKSALSLLTLAIALGMFIVLPQALAAWANRLGHLSLDVRSAQFQALTGLFKLGVITTYLVAIRQVKDIRRVFQYHGAEHKTISTYEAELPLTPEHARRMTTLHPRCGTTFVVMVALVSVVVFSFVGSLLPRLGMGAFVDNAALLLFKLPFLPVLAGVTFELQRLTARFCTTGPLRALLWPGFLVQKITTIEPDDEQLEVALAAMRVTLWREQAPEAAPAAQADRTFASFEALATSSGWDGAAAAG